MRFFALQLWHTGMFLEESQPQIWAESIQEIQEGACHTIILNPRRGYSHTFYQVNTTTVERAPQAGWLQTQAVLNIDTMRIDLAKPITFYDGHPTDWHTGQASFTSYYNGDVPPGSYEDLTGNPTTWTLTIRRSK